MPGHTNYDFERSISSKDRVLLHCCCAPCAAPALESFKDTKYKVDCYYFNPNIKPDEEYYKRLEQLKILCAAYKVKLILPEFDGSVFDNAVRGLEKEKEGGQRCDICFDLRLGKTAAEAKKNNYEYFCTTLTLSPHKNSMAINSIGCRIALEHNITYLASNFKSNNGNLISKQICERLNLYRQNYCGCTPSTNNDLTKTRV